MSAYEAVQICPYIVPLQVHYEQYQAISREINAVLNGFAHEIEAYSMDEYFLEVSFLLKRDRREIVDFSIQLKNEIYRKTKLTASVGSAYSKTYSKLASDLRKPNGLAVVLDTEEAAQFLYPHSLNEVWGISWRRFEKLKHEIGQCPPSFKHQAQVHLGHLIRGFDQDIAPRHVAVAYVLDELASGLQGNAAGVEVVEVAVDTIVGGDRAPLRRIE